MNARFRLLLIGIGALLVVATYTFPLWFSLFRSDEEVFPFPELPADLYPAFAQLSAERRADYLTLRRDNIGLAITMASAALQPDQVVPMDEQTPPNLSGQQAIRQGTFGTISPNRAAEGNLTLYELPDGNRYLWLEEFSAIQAPDLRLYLSRHTTASLTDLKRDEELTLTPEDIFLGRLVYNVGNQRFDVPREADLAQYGSILLFSQELSLVYSIANLR